MRKYFLIVRVAAMTIDLKKTEESFHFPHSREQKYQKQTLHHQAAS